MFWDISIAVLVAVLQLATAYIGYKVTMSPPSENKKWFYELLFILCGLGGIALVGIGAYRAITSNQSLQADISALKNGQQAANKGIAQIEEHTSKPAVINVSPLPKPTATVVLADYKTAILQREPGKPDKPILAAPNHKLSMNIYFKNSGPAAATAAIGLGKIYLASESSVAMDKKLAKQFQVDIKRLQSLSTMNLEPNGDQQWFTIDSDEALSVDDVNGLANGSKFVYMFFSETFRDPSGSHYQHYCMKTQAPETDPQIWNICDVFTNRK